MADNVTPGDVVTSTMLNGKYRVLTGHRDPEGPWWLLEEMDAETTRVLVMHQSNFDVYVERLVPVAEVASWLTTRSGDQALVDDFNTAYDPTSERTRG